MGAFALPSLPTLPSLPSVKSFINTSPPLVYQNHLPRDSPNTTPTRHARRRETDDGPLQHQPRALLPASPSRTDVSKEWDQVDRRRRDSMTSLKSSASYSSSMNELASSVGSLNLIGVPAPSNPSPVRPTHRRTQSAAPRRPGPSPMGRLHEISRNPLASSSAVSLPTLCELDADPATGQKPFPARSVHGASAPVSPVIAPRTRRVSRPTAIERIDPSDVDDRSEYLSSPPSPSPLSLPKPLPMIVDCSQQTIRARTRAHHRSMSSVPPPNSMPPPTSTAPCRPPAARAKTLMRPPSSPRSLSAEDTRTQPAVPSDLGRRSSLSSNLRIGSTSVSDVAVLATWSFPADLSGAGRRENAPGVSEFGEKRNRPDPPSLGLRQRLQSLSNLNTSLPSSSSTASLSSSVKEHAPGASLKRATSTAIRTSAHNKPHLGHRHSHSSPNLLPLLPVSVSGPINTVTGSHSVGSTGQLLPPPRPQRRPTTSRLRNPNPLCMPIHQPLSRERDTSHHALSSSPGSLFSDSRSTSAGSDGDIIPSPNGSIVSLPPLVPLPTDVKSESVSGVKDTERGFIGRWIRGSRASEVDMSRAGVIQEELVRAKVDGMGKAPGYEDEEAEDERYLSLDDI